MQKSIITAPQNPVAKGMILAAGLGTRLKPWTDTHPKALAMVRGKSLLQRNIEYLQQYGIMEVVVNVHHFADQVTDAIKINQGWGSNIIISNEREELLETGGGLLKASQLLADSELVALLNVDVLTDLDLAAIIGYHQEKKPLVTLATTHRETSRYFLFDEGNNLCGWRNVATGKEIAVRPLEEKVFQRAFSGVHIIDTKIFNLIHRTGKFSLVDVYLDLMNKYIIKSFDHSQGRFIDVGKPESILKAEAMFF